MHDAGLEEIGRWWRGLSPRGRVRALAAVALPGGGVLIGYVLGMRHLWRLTLAYGRSHPDVVTGPLWLMAPLPHIWPYLLAGAAVGALAYGAVHRLTRRTGRNGSRASG